MPEIRIANRGVSLDVNPAFSLLNNLLMARIPVQTFCGGRAQCGRCRFRVIEGAAHLSPVLPAETARLGDALIAAGWRLSCQTHALLDVTIELPGMDEELDAHPQQTD